MYHSVGTVSKSNIKIVGRYNIDTLKHKYMTAHLLGLLERRQLSGTCVRVRVVDFASVSTGLSIIFWNFSDSVVFFLLDFETVPTVRYFFYWILKLFWQCGIFFYWILKLFRQCGIFLLDFETVPTVMNFFIFSISYHYDQ